MCKSALRVALTEFHQAGRDDRRRCRAWKLLLLLPRLLLFKPARGGLLPKRQLQERFDQFMRGQWTQLLISSRDCCESQHRRRRTQIDTIDRRAERAEALVTWENFHQVVTPSRVLLWHLGMKRRVGR